MALPSSSKTENQGQTTFFEARSLWVTEKRGLSLFLGVS
jgi:hypothetical protein